MNHYEVEHNFSALIHAMTVNFSLKVANADSVAAGGYGRARVASVLDQYFIPSLCVIGIVGNIVNLIVLTRSRYRHNEAVTETGATLGLVLLSLSDLIFCIVMFPRAFILSTHSLFTSRSFLLYYQTLGTGFVTTFILTSTWITVTMAVLRFLAICHPLRSRSCAEINSYRAVYCIPIVLCILFNLPSFWQFSIAEIGQDEMNVTTYLVDLGYMDHTKARGSVFQWLKAVIGLFIPAVLLIYCNCSLVIALKRSYRMRKQCHVRETGSGARNRVTLTLITIVTAFILLVVPSELMDFFYECIQMDAAKTELFMEARAIANTLQVLNFACNFFLYCSVNSQFRTTMKAVVNKDCGSCRSNNLNSPRSTHYQLRSMRSVTTATAAVP